MSVRRVSFPERAAYPTAGAHDTTRAGRTWRGCGTAETFGIFGVYGNGETASELSQGPEKHGDHDDADDGGPEEIVLREIPERPVQSGHRPPSLSRSILAIIPLTKGPKRLTLCQDCQSWGGLLAALLGLPAGDFTLLLTLV